MADEFHINARADWNDVVRINKTTHDFFESIDLPEDAVDTFTMVACELVENGIKYGDNRHESSDEVELSVIAEDETITIQVNNRIGEQTQPHLQQLDRTIQWVRGFQDPFQAYIERIKEISHEPSTHRTSGLGIVRISYEARAAVDFIVDDDNTLSVSAVAKSAR